MREDPLKLFGKKKNEKPTALVFVDFEYMLISFKKRYGVAPPILDWYRTLCDEYEVLELYVFADFSNEAMKRQLPVLRQITDNIIETQNTASRHKKDFTDFFLLDRVYQKAFENNRATTYILFTGDGHFGAVSRFLIKNCKKDVVINGVEGNISGTLKSQVTRVVEYPGADRVKELYYPYIARQIKELTTGRHAQRMLTPGRLSAACIERQKLHADILEEAMTAMLNEGYLVYKEVWVSSLKRTRVLTCDFEKMMADGIYHEDTKE